MGTPQDFKAFQEGIQKSLVSTVKTANRIAAEDLSFQRTVNPEVAEQLDDKSARVLALSTRLLQSAAKTCGIKPPSLEDAEDIDMNWQSIVDVVDSVLEKADTALDEYTGLIKRKDSPSAETGPKPKKPKSTAKVIRNANITKPQTLFQLAPHNFPDGPWKPILTKKPHATLSLKKSLTTIKGEDGSSQYQHPYETEITKMAYPDNVFEKAKPIPSQPADSTEATWVDTYEGVLSMLEDLKQAKEIAVDLEHHDFRTYTGLVCLMQISTREKDWIVDTLQPWRHKLEILNEVFADPAIVKVFHGAYMDMVWLQRDLGLYVNGLFDTFFACDEMHYPGKSLAFLLSRFVDFDADKQYQLADWRLRPIPEEMMYYARSDTHYLLYIYDRVRNELVTASNRSVPEEDHIGKVLERSRELSLSRHEHPTYNEETGEGSRGWYNYVFKHPHLAFDGEQFAVFKAIWKWRDDVARQEDESPNFVLGTNNVAEVSRVNPPDVKALHSLLPITAPLARARLKDIWARVQEAKARGGPSLLHFFTSMTPESAPNGKLPKMTVQSSQLPQLEGEEITVVRLPKSHLFGNVPISSRWEVAKESTDNLQGNVPFPWQRFVQDGPADAQIHDDQVAGEAQEAIPAANLTEASSKANTEALENEEFTLKKGRKRKSEEFETSTSSDEESDSASEEEEEEEEEESIADENGKISIVDKAPRRNKKLRRQQRQVKRQEEDEELTQKREAKLARKAKKQEKRKQVQVEKEKKYSAVPFDYTKAASVINASRSQNTPAGKQPKKVFDPYSKTGEDGIKGARKMPPVRGERSATFKK